MGTLDYLKNLFSDKNVASITPSSEFTVKRVCDKIDFTRDIHIVEYGPGDGVFTKYLLDHITPDSKITAIETNEGFVEILKKFDDQRLSVYQDSAENVGEIISNSNAGKADYIISGIPFSFIPQKVKKKIIAATHKSLHDNGSFLIYQTSKHVLPFVEEVFEHVTDELEIKNIPPMVVMEAFK